jgi:hypothetical protein
VITLAATIYLGVLPGQVLGFAQRSARQLVQPEAPASDGQSPAVEVSRHPM